MRPPPKRRRLNGCALLPTLCGSGWSNFLPISAIAVAQSLGVILSEAARKNIPVEELTPVQIKQAVTGDGRADKKAVQMMIRHILGMKKNPEPDHAADALAAAVAGSRFHTFRRRIQEGV